MQKVGVPIVPGYHGEAQSLQVLQQAAADIGYPVLIKAVAGGGGKGMRRVNRPEEFAAHLASAQSEAQGAFGNARVLIEKFIANPRHIEIQIFGDGQTAVHLYERDCSLQRRHQKVIEEAPAPLMPNEVRDAMGQAAVRAGRAGASGQVWTLRARRSLTFDCIANKSTSNPKALQLVHWIWFAFHSDSR